MKLSPSTIEYIDRVTSVAQLAGIDALVFRKDVVSGKDDVPSVLLIQKEGIPDFEFDELAVIRVPYFRQRMDAIRSSNGAFTFDYDPQVGMVTFSSGRSKAEYRAGNALAVRPPKGLADQDRFQFTVDADFTTLISRAASAYPSKDPIIVFTSSGTDVEISITDDEAGDSFTSVVSSDLQGDGALSVRYSLKTLLPLLKQHESATLKVSAKGILSLSIRGIHILLIPRV